MESVEVAVDVSVAIETEEVTLKSAEFQNINGLN
jgi:hypothetical protein